MTMTAPAVSRCGAIPRSNAFAFPIATGMAASPYGEKADPAATAADAIATFLKNSRRDSDNPRVNAMPRPPKTLSARRKLGDILLRALGHCKQGQIFELFAVDSSQFPGSAPERALRSQTPL